MIQRESQRLAPSIYSVLVPRALQSKARGTEHVEGSNFDHPSRRTAIPNCMQGASMHACIPHRQAPMQTSLAQRQAANAAWHQCISTSRSATDMIFSAEPIWIIHPDRFWAAAYDSRAKARNRQAEGMLAYAVGHSQLEGPEWTRGNPK